MSRKPDQERKSLFVSSLKGDLLALNSLVACIPNNKLNVFISSTFTDTHQERNILHESILPKLQIMGRENDIQITLSDLRFGIKDKNNEDHLTWHYCQSEIKHCYEESGGIFFLSLQSEKYGYAPLPRNISKTEFENVLRAQSHNESIQKLLKYWYIEDLNSLPASFVLRNLTKQNKEQYWKVALPTLTGGALNEVPFEDLAPYLINHSITEWETFLATSLDPARCFWVSRKFASTSLFGFNSSLNAMGISDVMLANQTERKRKLTGLKVALSEKLPSKNIHDVNIGVDPIKYLNGQVYIPEYFQKWESEVLLLFQQEIDTLIKAKSEWEKFSQREFNVPVQYIDEMLQHAKSVWKKSSTFIERKTLIVKGIQLLATITEERAVLRKQCDPLTARVRGFLDDYDLLNRFAEPSTRSRFSAVSFCIVGKSGCGKTAFISKLFTEVRSTLNQKNHPMIIRFCGTSKYSLHGIDLVQSISLQILLIYRKYKRLRVYLSDLSTMSYEKAVQEFRHLLARFPIILFLDSLDQLSDLNEARSQLSFLSFIVIHNDSRIIVSCLPDEIGQNGNKTYFYQCESRLRGDGVRFLQVPVFDGHDESEITEIVNEMLKKRDRQLQSDQLLSVVNSIRQEPTILYITLAVEVASHWCSFQTDSCVYPGVTGIINQLLADLESQFGQCFTSYAFAFLTFSNAGVNDIEMQDLLSLVDVVIDEVFQYSKLVRRRIPLHVWLRLKTVIRNLTVEKQDHCLRWYHRQLWESAAERYASIRVLTCQILGRYFGDKLSESLKKDRLISDQFLSMNSTFIWSSTCKVNQRRVTEASFHLVTGELYNLAIEEICCFENICASILIGEGFKFVRNLHDLLIKDPNNLKALHYYKWLRNSLKQILANPRQSVLATATAEPYSSLVRQDVMDYISAQFPFGSLEHLRFNRPVFVKEFTLNGMIDFNSMSMMFHGKEKDLEWTYDGHSGDVLTIAWNHDNTRILSGSADRTIKIWNVITGQILQTLYGHSDAVLKADWNNDDSTIASASKDKTVKIWNVLTGHLLFNLTKHTNEVTSLIWSNDGQRLVSGSMDKSIVIWDAIVGNVLSVLDFKLAEVLCLFLPAGDQNTMYSGSLNGNICLWNLVSSVRIASFGKPENTAVTALASDVQMNSLVSGHQNGSMRLWGRGSVAFEPMVIITTLNAHSRPITCIESCIKGNCFASSSSDGSLKVWTFSELRMISSFEKKDIRIFSVSWNEEGTSIAFGSSDRSIKILELKEIEYPKLCQGHSDQVTSIAWSSDDTRIVTGSLDKTMKIWDATTGCISNTFRGHKRGISCIKVFKDSILSTSRDCTIRVWNSVDGSTQRSYFGGHPAAVLVGKWNQSGTRLATGCDDKTVRIWDVINGSLLAVLKGHSQPVNRLDWNQDDTRIVSGTEVGKSVRTAILANTSREIKIWNVLNKNVVVTMKRHVHDIVAVEWNSSSLQIISCSKDGMVCISFKENAEGTERYPVRFTLKLDRSSSISACWHPCLQNHFFVGYENAVVHLEIIQENPPQSNGKSDEKATFKENTVIEFPSLQFSSSEIFTFTCFSLSGDGRLLATGSLRFQNSDDKRNYGNDNGEKTQKPLSYDIHIWDAISSEYCFTLNGHTDKVTSLCWKKNCTTGYQLFSASDDLTIKLWDVLNEFLLGNIRGHTERITCIALSGDDFSVVSSSVDTTVKIWNTASGQLKFVFEGHCETVNGIDLSPDGLEIVSCSSDKTIKFWDANTGRNLRKVPIFLNENTSKSNPQQVGRSSITSIAWDHEGKLLATGSRDHSVKLWTNDLVELATLKVHVKSITVISWSPDDTHLLSTSEDATLCVWSKEKKETIFSLNCHDKAILAAAWNPDGSRIATGSADFTIKIIDFKTQAVLLTCKGHSKPVRCLAWNHQGTKLASGSEDTLIKVWDAIQG
jgi:WD40 repeat protein/Cdc6-like AAA superfamily ATPase